MKTVEGTSEKLPKKKSSNVMWQERRLTKSDHCRRNGHRSMVLWFTGLSGSGKSTLAHQVEEKLFARGCYTYILDGDNVRHGLNGDLGFSEIDRRENIQRIGEVAKLFVDAGVIVLAHSYPLSKMIATWSVHSLNRANSRKSTSDASSISAKDVIRKGYTGRQGRGS